MERHQCAGGCLWWRQQQQHDQVLCKWWREWKSRGGPGSCPGRWSYFCGGCRVWPLTRFFFCFLFVKNHWFAWRANQWLLIGRVLFSSFLPSNSLVSISDPWRAFKADTVPFNGPRLVRWFQMYREPRTPSDVPCLVRRCQDTVKNSWRKPWLLFFWKHTFWHRSLIVKVNRINYQELS